MGTFVVTSASVSANSIPEQYPKSHWTLSKGCEATMTYVGIFKMAKLLGKTLDDAKNAALSGTVISLGTGVLEVGCDMAATEAIDFWTSQESTTMEDYMDRWCSDGSGAGCVPSLTTIPPDQCEYFFCPSSPFDCNNIFACGFDMLGGGQLSVSNFHQVNNYIAQGQQDGFWSLVGDNPGGGTGGGINDEL